MSSDGHVPRRPTWECVACGQPWPCPPARAQLTAELAAERVSTVSYLTAQMWVAYADLRAPVAELVARFLGWVGR